MPSLDIVIPCLNEEGQLPQSLDALLAFCRRHMTAYRWRILVADNGSSDRTYPIALDYAARLPSECATIRLEQRGRGRALRQAWTDSTADIVCYMDVDLSTGLAALPPLISAIAEGGYDVAVGSRLARGSIVARRTLKREVVSRCYNLLIKAMFFTRFSDAQCGFKALSRRAVREILPVTKDLGWFLDSEILIIAEKRGYKIKDVPVRWTDDPDTRVKVVKTAWGDIKGLLRLRFRGIPRPVRDPRPGPPSPGRFP
ncbi:MAG: glycosyltransferase family 2 protein [Dehalococcoidia bacterium]|nr:glycosyltransferase family 2 protein [Dehalococcoidia bacterium]